VLGKKTRGYEHHPQLLRFRAARGGVAAWEKGGRLRNSGKSAKRSAQKKKKPG